MATTGRATKWISLAVFVGVVAAAASFGAIFKPGPWYAALVKPPWTPPNWVFGPVWTALYVMIAVAGWLVWRSDERGRALRLWIAALVLNAAWSWLFFGQHWIGAALADIVLLLVAIMAFARAAWPVNRLASALFWPYLAWVAYATTLNGAIWVLNT